MPDYKYVLRVPPELIVQAQERAIAESSDLAKVLRLFLQRYGEGRISLVDLLRARPESALLSATPGNRMGEDSGP